MNTETARMRVYCAGPLFNDKEREQMDEISSALEAVGFYTFLPHRDGLELTKCVNLLLSAGIPEYKASQMMAKAIFALDVYQVLVGCEAVVANLNGRVPDEGMISEVALAWANGKVVVGFKTDTRTVFGGQDNPLVSGLFGFTYCDSLKQLVGAIQTMLTSRKNLANNKRYRATEINEFLQLGGSIWELMQNDRDIASIVNVLVENDASAITK